MAGPDWFFPPRKNCTETASQVFRPIFGPFDFGLFTRPGNLKTSVKQNPGRPPVGRKRIRNGTKIKLGATYVVWYRKVLFCSMDHTDFYLMVTVTGYLYIAMYNISTDSVTAAGFLWLFGKVLRKIIWSSTGGNEHDKTFISRGFGWDK